MRTPHQQTIEQLQLLRESFRNPSSTASGSDSTKKLLREDIQGVDNTARNELQQAMSAALGAALVVSTVEEQGGVTVVKGILRLGQDLRFTFTTQEPDGCSIDCQGLKLSESNAQILAKLQAYHATWYNQLAGGDAQPAPGNSPT
jgi:hypothetical protein